ncbi:MAG TPA: MFS transporter, partial [Clostridia bacterium]|nr:MFS transporter [Clostridia bacterium]
MRETVKRILTWSSPRANRNISEYGPKERNFFLVGMAGQNIIYALIGAALNMFYTDVLFVGTVTVAIVMAVSRFWDALNDMIMGTVVDRTHTRWGKCRPYLKYVPIPIAICTILLFLPLGGAPGWLKICYIVLSYLLWETLYTLGDIPLWGMTSLMTPDEKKRTKLISSARIVGSLSAIVIAFFAPLKDMFGKINMGIFPNTGKPNFTGYFSEAQGYLLAVSLIAILGGVMFSFVFPNVRERVASNNSKEADTTFSQNLQIMFRNKPFLLAVLSMILGSTKNMVTTAGLYYCKWVLGNGSEGLWIIIFGAAFIGGLLVSMAISPYIGRRFGKKRVLIATSYL